LVSKLEQLEEHCHAFVAHLFLPASATCCLLPTCRDFFVNQKKQEVGVCILTPKNSELLVRASKKQKKQKRQKINRGGNSEGSGDFLLC